MGKNIEKYEYSSHDFRHFQQKLYQQLEELKDIINLPSFGDETLKIGAELEMYLVDDKGEVSLSNQFLLEKLNDPQYQHELNQYNLELNLSAVPIAGKPFTSLRNEIIDKTRHLEKVAKAHNINIVPVGILPTLRAEHLNANFITDIPRYKCLAKHLYQQRGEAFRININGEEPIAMNFSDISAEGANTSFQVHLMTPHKEFKDIFNAAQLTAPLVTAVAANSGVFLGNRVWDETRIALFKQSLDIRADEAIQWQQPTRVNFGHGWVRKDAWELYAEAVALYPPIIPQIFDNQNNSTLSPLHELSLHMGTIWPWHRPVYCHEDNGHIRIEFRAIPAGPTSIDMVANSAFAIGLASGLKNEINSLISFIPFRFAEYNFYRTAQHGLDAHVLWPLKNKYQPTEVRITDVIVSMLPIAKKGLMAIGIDESEADFYLNIIEHRVATKTTGASWQKQTLKYFEKKSDKQTACQLLVQQYIKNCRSCQPVSTWEKLWT